MGQVWSSADFDGINEVGFQGGRGSPLAVTAQNPGPDGQWDTADDVIAPLNGNPCWVSLDHSTGSQRDDPLDRVRGFNSLHPAGANFSLADGSVRFVAETIDTRTYRYLSTVSGGEVIAEY